MKSLKKIISEWLFYAQEDLRGAEGMLRDEIFNLVCFLSQQCVEKVLKALLVYEGEIAPKSHDLVDLLKRLKENRGELLEFKEETRWLNRFYVPTRYPDTLPGSLPEGLPNKEDAQKSVEIAHKIFEKGKEILEKESKS